MADETILIVEDEEKIRMLLRNVLEDEGFLVREAVNADGVMRAMTIGRIDLITMDIHLGTENGLDLVRKVRQQSAVPIIMVTGKDDVIDRVVGLEIGADDYITKPFHIREVVARIRSVLRRAGRTKKPEATADQENPADAVDGPETHSLEYHFDGLIAVPDLLELRDRDREDCALTTGDFKLLKIFLERPKRVLSRDQLMDLTGGLEWSPLDRTIDNQIARLRKKIERDSSDPKLIKTVRGVGYAFACDVIVAQSSFTPSSSDCNRRASSD
jgi:DNA-binding response OmpR family regulator